MSRNNEPLDEYEPLSERELLEEIVMTLVTHSDKVRVEERFEDTERSSILTIISHADDHGKVIGKKGATIRILRELFKRIGSSYKKKIFIEIVDTTRDKNLKSAVSL